MRKPETAALLIAVMLHRSSYKRARLSDKTFRQVSKRKKLRVSFVSSVIDVLQRDMGIVMTELDSGGYGLLYVKSLEAARHLTAKKYFPDNIHRSELDEDTLDILWEEISPEEDEGQYNIEDYDFII